MKKSKLRVFTKNDWGYSGCEKFSNNTDPLIGEKIINFDKWPEVKSWLFHHKVDEKNWEEYGAVILVDKNGIRINVGADEWFSLNLKYFKDSLKIFIAEKLLSDEVELTEKLLFDLGFEKIQ